MSNGSETLSVFTVQAALRAIGYQLPSTGRWDGPTEAALRAVALILEIPLALESSEDRREVHLRPPMLDRMAALSEEWAEIDDVGDLVREAHRLVRIAPTLAGMMQALQQRGSLSETIASAYDDFVSTGLSLLELVAARIEGVEPVLESLEDAGAPLEEVTDALSSLPLPAFLGGTVEARSPLAGGALGNPLPQVVIVGIIVAVVLAVGFGGFALASGEIQAIVRELQQTLRTVALAVAGLLGLGEEELTTISENVAKPQAPPTNIALIVGLLAAAGLGGFFIWRRFRQQDSEGLSLPTEGHIDLVEQSLRGAEQSTTQLERMLRAGQSCPATGRRLFEASTLLAQARAHFDSAEVFEENASRDRKLLARMERVEQREGAAADAWLARCVGAAGGR